MRIIYGLLWLAIVNTCQASEITCYSGKTRIYHGYAHDIMYNDISLLFTEDKTNKTVMITADCIVLEPFKYQGHVSTATEQ